MIRRHKGLAGVAIVLLLQACTDDGGSPLPVQAESAEQTQAAPSPAVTSEWRFSVLPADPSTLPMLANALPRRVPGEEASLQPLLTNLPGTARMAYHPPEHWEDPEGWLGEDILFYGADGAWRRLQMADLGLPESAWPGPDTYGAGSLSPNGRWWTAESGAGVIVVNLSTGTTRLIELPMRFMAQATWLPDSSAFVVESFGRGQHQTVKVSVPDGSVERVPYSESDVGFEPDGTPISLERKKRGVRLVEWRGKDKVIRGALPPALTIGEKVLRSWSTAATIAFSASREEKRAAAYQIVTVDSVDRTVEAVLRYPNKDYVSVEGWLDAQTLLIKTADHLLAWRPTEQRIYRVTKLTNARPNRYSTISVAVDHR